MPAPQPPVYWLRTRRRILFALKAAAKRGRQTVDVTVMKKGGTGGESTLTGLAFERKVDVSNHLQQLNGYEVKPAPNKTGDHVFFNNSNEPIALICKKHAFYRYLTQRGVDWKDLLSKQLLPDTAVVCESQNKIYILEFKYQEVNGSVDEKLQTCDFKKRQYQKLASSLGMTVEYIYALSTWFKDEKYDDVLNYIKSMECDYVYDQVPLSRLGLPLPL